MQKGVGRVLSLPLHVCKGVCPFMPLPTSPVMVLGAKVIVCVVGPKNARYLVVALARSHLVPNAMALLGLDGVTSHEGLPYLIRVLP